MISNAFGLIYAGESNPHLKDLTLSRSIGAVPFGGRYRCIDFILSDMVNSGLTSVGVIAEKNYHSLMDHLGSGKEWDLHRKREGLYILPPFMTKDSPRCIQRLRRRHSFRSGLCTPGSGTLLHPLRCRHRIKCGLYRHDGAAPCLRGGYHHALQ